MHFKSTITEITALQDFGDRIKSSCCKHGKPFQRKSGAYPLFLFLVAGYVKIEHDADFKGNGDNFF